MSKRIEFFNKETGEAVNTCFYYFVLNGNEVWRDNGQYFESQCDVISFENCIEKCDNIDWKVIYE
jgi:hypothetical protein